MAAVRPFWESLSGEERAKMLTLRLEDVRARAQLLSERQAKQDGA